MIYPWQKTQWQRLQDQVKTNRLPHAILFSGANGLGKSELARHFSVSLLVRNRNHQVKPAGNVMPAT